MAKPLELLLVSEQLDNSLNKHNDLRTNPNDKSLSDINKLRGYTYNARPLFKIILGSIINIGI
jgi:hypothetical protein